MSYFFSPSTKGFYNDTVHGADMPADAVEVSDMAFEQAMADREAGRAVTMVGGQLTAQAPSPALPKPRRAIPSLEFRNRFSPSTKARLTLEASQALERGDPKLQVFMDDVNSAGVVHLDNPEVVAGVDYLLDRQLITPRQRDEILS